MCMIEDGVGTRLDVMEGHIEEVNQQTNDGVKTRFAEQQRQIDAMLQEVRANAEDAPNAAGEA